MLQFLTPRLTLIGVALLVFAWTTQTVRLRFTQKDVQTLKAHLAASDSAVESANAVNAKCAAATKIMIASANAQQMALDKAAANLQGLIHQAAATRAKLQAQENTDRALPQCQVLLAIDLAAVCPGHAAAIRLRANPLPGPRD